MKALHHTTDAHWSGEPCVAVFFAGRTSRWISVMWSALLAAAVLMGAMSLPRPAWAAFVSQWAFVVNNGFTAFSPSGVAGSNDNAFLTSLPAGGIPALGGGNIGPFTHAPTLLSWGVSTGSGQSSLSAGSPTGMVSGTVMTNGAAANTLVLTHANNPIFSPFLETATLTSVLQLTPMTPPGTSFQLPAAQFAISFTETPNASPCVAPGDPPCSDIFVVDVAGAGFNPTTNSFEQPFIGPMGVPYVGKLSLTGLMPLTDAECMAASASTGCQGFITQEGTTNNFQATLAITAVPLPPAGILFFTALVGLATFARRRKAKGA